ncbi:unnamed protein product [Rhizoctonia solani]|uniref:Protein kinase domain-containing protein n=1 Tax=Rhizoctonia solani TaxID=456999 RepID=A0A8H3D7X1_9AGAM|nr:unnamed protein product [Rhizoctonia solani]CAE7083458.1 unnamed protein product [Rhizoctonia solani]
MLKPTLPFNYFPPHNLLVQYEKAGEILDGATSINVARLTPQWLQNAEEFQGGFSCVKKAIWKDRTIVVKFLSTRRVVSSDAKSREQSFRREIHVWHKLSHPNILPLLGVVCLEGAILGMASPFMANGAAPGYINRNPEADVFQIIQLCDVAEGLGYLAAQTPPVAHGDLKGANVLIDSDGRACICDFGLSRFLGGHGSADVSCFGTTRWMAPEQLISDPMIVSLSADIFSWGMLALEVSHRLISITSTNPTTS